MNFSETLNETTFEAAGDLPESDTECLLAKLRFDNHFIYFKCIFLCVYICNKCNNCCLMPAGIEKKASNEVS